MKALAQIRAANALRDKDMIVGGQGDGDVISGYPTMIKTDGLLAALAFAVEPKDGGRKHKGEYSIAKAIATHLCFPDIAITQAQDPDGLVDELAQAQDASQLRRATAETLAYLNYLKRFVA